METRNNESSQEPSKNISRPMASSLAVLAGLVRLIPHPWNFTPGGAVELFAGARLRSWHAFIVPLLVRAVTDILLLAVQGLVADPLFYVSFLPFVYVSIVLNVLLGRTLCRTESPWRIGSVTLLASIQFYLVTNFGAWIGSIDYPHTLQGLLTCYLAGLPFASSSQAPPLGFLGNSMAANLGYAAILFGAHAWLTRLAFPRERIGAMVSSPQVSHAS